VVITARGIWVKARHAVMYRDLLCCLPRRGDLLPCAVVYLGVVVFCFRGCPRRWFYCLGNTGDVRARTHTHSSERRNQSLRTRKGRITGFNRDAQREHAGSAIAAVRWCLSAGWVAVASSTEKLSTSTLSSAEKVGWWGVWGETDEHHGCSKTPSQATDKAPKDRGEVAVM